MVMVPEYPENNKVSAVEKNSLQTNTGFPVVVYGSAVKRSPPARDFSIVIVPGVGPYTTMLSSKVPAGRAYDPPPGAPTTDTPFGTSLLCQKESNQSWKSVSGGLSPFSNFVFRYALVCIAMVTVR